MSSLGDALYRMVTGGKPQSLGGWREQIAELSAHYGSERRAAAATGLSRSTWQRWKSGRVAAPKLSTLGKLIGETRRVRMVDAVPSDASFEIDTVDRDSGRERVITGRQLQLKQGTVQAVVDAYLATGDPEAMAMVLWHGIQEPVFYRRYLLPRDSGQDGPKDSPGTSGGDAVDNELDDVADAGYEDWYAQRRQVYDDAEDLAHEGDPYMDADYGADVSSAG